MLETYRRILKLLNVEQLKAALAQMITGQMCQGAFALIDAEGRVKSTCAVAAHTVGMTYAEQATERERIKMGIGEMAFWGFIRAFDGAPLSLSLSRLRKMLEEEIASRC